MPIVKPIRTWNGAKGPEPSMSMVVSAYCESGWALWYWTQDMKLSDVWHTAPVYLKMKQDWLKPVLRTVKGGSSRTESRMTIKQDHSTGLDPSAITRVPKLKKRVHQKYWPRVDIMKPKRQNLYFKMQKNI